MATCAKCGAELAAIARFCGTCGARITAGSLPSPPRPTTPSADPFAATVYGGDDAKSPPGPPAVTTGASAAASVAPPLPPGVSRGARVLVQWSDGNRYPATVLHINGTSVLIAFSTGQQHWVDARYLSAGR
jgi:hypothetical protein